MQTGELSLLPSAAFLNFSTAWVERLTQTFYGIFENKNLQTKPPSLGYKISFSHASNRNIYT